jgi:hypothetical protein
MWGRITRWLGIEILKPKKMIVNYTDNFVLLEVNADDITKSEPMNLEEISKYVFSKYGEQPLQYFNEYKRLKIVHLKTGTIKNLELKVEF